MKQQLIPVICVLCLGGGTVFGAFVSGSEPPDWAGRIEERLASLTTAVAEGRRDAELTRVLAALEQRLGLLETPPVSRVCVDPIPEVEDAHAEAPVATGKEGPDHALRREYRDLMERVVQADSSFGGSVEDQERFWELARTSGVLEDVIGALEAEVAADPTNFTARLALADAYMVKLLTVPSGPERGVWGAKCEEQWQEILRLDDRNWEAQFRYANNLSYYPEFLGRADEAIAGLERARELQEALPSCPAHVQTYLSLCRLYVASDDLAGARAALEAGLLRHPGDPKIIKALANLAS